MAEKKKAPSIDDYMNDKEAKSIDEKFGKLKSWEDTTDADQKGKAFYDAWYENIYKAAQKAIQKVAGGLDKELNIKAHENSLKGEFGNMILGYLEKASTAMSSTDSIEFHELKERIKEQGLSGRALFDAVSEFYNAHTAYSGRGRPPVRDYMSLSDMLDRMLVGGKKGEEMLAVMRQQHNIHAQAAQVKYRSNKSQEILGDLHPAKARLYMRKHVLPQYGAKIESHTQFHKNEVGEAYNLWKGFKHGDAVEYKELGVKYKPLPVPKKG